ncbi:MAG: YcdB/YcdC domain-containing protein [Oscillospiraceae bacterium]
MKKLYGQLLSGALAAAMVFGAVPGTEIAAANIISVEEANAAYRELNGLKAEYRLFVNKEYNFYENRWEYDSFILPVYVSDSLVYNEIDAVTGGYTSFYEDMDRYGAYADVVLDTGCEGEDAVLGRAAEDVPESMRKGLISRSSALRRIKSDRYITLDGEPVFLSEDTFSRVNDSGEREYMISVSFEDTSSEDGYRLDVEMDAYTGNILRFEKTRSEEHYEGKSTDVKAVRSIAEGALEYYLGERAEEYHLSEYDSKVIGAGGNMTFTFYRSVNGLDADFDSAEVTVDFNGEVTGFDYTYHDMDFPEPELITEDEAYDMLFEQMSPELVYMSFEDMRQVTHVYPVYVYDSRFIINALTGEAADENGRPYHQA